MESLIIGAVLGIAGLRLATWATGRNILVKWYAWVLFVLAVLLAALTAIDYATLMAAMEPDAASVILWLFGGPALILACIAVALVWWQNRSTAHTPTKTYDPVNPHEKANR